MRHILIADSDQAVCDYEKNLLELSGFHVDIVNDGEEGLARIRMGGYDLYILALMLPGADGFELLTHIRRSTMAPVVIVTARRDEPDLVRAFTMGADDYITKPLLPGEFLARIKACFERKERILSSVGSYDSRYIERGDLTIDRIDMRVWIGKEEKLLTTREFDILLYLAEHPSEVISREELARALWSDDEYLDTSTIPVHILHLRRKLTGDSSKRTCLETVWGKGYRFRS